MQFAAKKVC